MSIIFKRTGSILELHHFNKRWINMKLSTLIKESKAYTILNMLQELSTWIDWDKDILAKAKASKITDKNNRIFKSLVNGWVDGDYDDDPEAL